MTARLDTDLVVIGSGFGGSLLAMIARRLGWRVALLERGRHPRFAIGESASPLAGVVLEQLAARYDLPRVSPLASYGAWQRRLPEIGCGLKRGFTYYKHDAGRRFAPRGDRANELLVAASPSDELSDTHWLRSDVDQFLMQEAVACGVDYVDELTIEAVDWRASDVMLTGTGRRGSLRVTARLVVDASGPRGFLARLLTLDAPGFATYPGTQALYSHFTGVARCADLPEFSNSDRPPYPIDAAALHHVFDEGWMWVLRFDNGVTSAGIAVTDALAADLRLADGEPAWQRLLARYPSLSTQFADAQPIREFTWMPRASWRVSEAFGDRWMMLPSAAAFVDPLFSTGIPLTLLGVERIARLLETEGGLRSVVGRTLSGPPRDPDPATGSGSYRATPSDDKARGTTCATYTSTVMKEADHVARFIAGCYAAFPRFEDFTAWSMFYFAAASFSEMSRRLHGDSWSRGFLCADDEELGCSMEELSPTRLRGAGLSEGVSAAIDRINAAGLADPGKRNWYDVDAEDAVRAAHKLGAAPDAIRRMFSEKPG